MEIKTEYAKVIVKGIVENVDDCIQISSTAKEVAKSSSGSVTIEFPDSFVIPSTLIGQILKMIQVDNMTVSIKANNDLYELLDRLSLVSIFNVSKI